MDTTRVTRTRRALRWIDTWTLWTFNPQAPLAYRRTR